MPFTVITLKNVPPSLRGDLTKWMQEIATGVYVGNFNSRVRENLWKRVCDAIGIGEATISYTCQNEIGYSFETRNSSRKVVDYDGIPLILLPPVTNESLQTGYKDGFSNAAKAIRAKRYAVPAKRKDVPGSQNIYVSLDIETTGLNAARDHILEIGAVKCEDDKISFFQQLIHTDERIPENIIRLTGITEEMVRQDGFELENALSDFLHFIQDDDLVGYNIEFDINFLNAALDKIGLPRIQNKTFDLMKAVKKEKLFQRNYKLQTTLRSYGIEKEVQHRALEDAKLIYALSTKINKNRW